MADKFIVDPIVDPIDGIINAGLFVFVVLGIVNVIRGEARELSVIGKYSILK